MRIMMSGSTMDIKVKRDLPQASYLHDGFITEETGIYEGEELKRKVPHDYHLLC